MCVSNQVPKREVKERLPEPSATKGGLTEAKGKADWVVGWKVLRRKKTGNRIKLLSAMANDEWRPGIMIAKKPDATNFTGSRMPDNEFGFHVLRVKPTLEKGETAQTVARLYFHADSVVAIGEDSAANLSAVETVVAKIVDFRDKDYQAALKGGSRTSKKLLKKVQKKIHTRVYLKEAVKIIQSIPNCNRDKFVDAVKLKGMTCTEARSLYSQANKQSKAAKKVQTVVSISQAVDFLKGLRDQMSVNRSIFVAEAKATFGLTVSSARSLYSKVLKRIKN